MYVCEYKQRKCLFTPGNTYASSDGKASDYTIDFKYVNERTESVSRKFISISGFYNAFSVNRYFSLNPDQQIPQQLLPSTVNTLCVYIKYYMHSAYILYKHRKCFLYADGQKCIWLPSPSPCTLYRLSAPRQRQYVYVCLPFMQRFCHLIYYSRWKLNFRENLNRTKYEQWVRSSEREWERIYFSASNEYRGTALHMK